MVQLGEWTVEVDIPADVSDGAAQLVSQAVTVELQRWAVDTRERLSREFGIDISIATGDA